jgi:hypothetical protein
VSPAAGEIVLSGRYRLVEPLATGGMGTVWRAYDDVLDRPVAVKEVLLPPGLDAEARDVLRQRTMREARAAAKLRHSAIVTIYDVVEHDDRPWIVMELVPAQSLDERIRSRGPLRPSEAAAVGLRILDALVTAQAAGVQHRDIKPANVLLADDGRVVLTDFGIARHVGDQTLTSAGLLVGSPNFLAPERARGLRSPGLQSDLWSLGATLYAAVEGRPPFERNGPLPTLAAVVMDEPPPPQRAGPLRTVIDGLLVKDPRYRLDADRTRAMLQRVLRPGGPVDAAADPVPAPRPAPADPTRPLPRVDGAGRPVAAAGAAAAAAAAAAASVPHADAAPAPAPAPADAAAPATTAADTGSPADADGTATEVADPPADTPAAAGPTSATTAAAGSTADADGAATEVAGPPADKADAAAGSPADADGAATATEVADPPADKADAAAGSPADADGTATEVAGPPADTADTADAADTPAATAAPAGATGAAEPVASAPPVARPAPASGPSSTGLAWPTDRRANRRRALLVAGVIAVLAAVALLLPQVLDDNRDQAAPPAPGTTAPSAGSGERSPTDQSAAPLPGPTSGPVPTTSTSPTRRPPPAAAVPAGFTRYTDPTRRFQVAVPTGWAPSPGRTAAQVRFDDPGSGRYLMIETSDDPQPDPYTNWVSYERQFSATRTNYENLGIRRVDYGADKGWRTADWEFRIGDTHVLDRNVLVSSQRAHAIYWSTPESLWSTAESRRIFQVAANTFVPAPVG